MEKSIAPIQLPQPRHDSSVSIEQTLNQRRSHRSFSGKSVSLENLAQLLWAAQGVTNTEGYRTAPSAGALYPIELYVVVANVAQLDPGVYRYDPNVHALFMHQIGDVRNAIAAAALNQSWLRQSSAIIVFSAIESRTTRKYGPRGKRYIHIEVGHAAENLFCKAWLWV